MTKRSDKIILNDRTLEVITLSNRIQVNPQIDPNDFLDLEVSPDENINSSTKKKIGSAQEIIDPLIDPNLFHDLENLPSKKK